MANPQPLVNWGLKAKGHQRDWQAALRRAITQHASPDVLRSIAEKVLEKALTGDMEAVKEIANRLDGKSVQATELTVNSNEAFRGMSIEEIRAMIKQRLATDTKVAAALGLTLEPEPIEGESRVIAPVDAAQR